MKTLLHLLILLPLLLLGAGCEAPQAISTTTNQPSAIEARSHVQNLVLVKYRDTAVDIASPLFESLDTARSSFIRGAWYDRSHEYLLLNLNGTYYHYCNFPVDQWGEFKESDSLGKAYNASIKGNYTCEGVSVPDYLNP